MAVWLWWGMYVLAAAVLVVCWPALWRDVVSLSGLGATLVGVGLTWRQARNAETSAKAAENAAIATKAAVLGQVSEREALSRITAAIGLVRMARELQADGKWIDAAERCADALEQLASAEGALPRLSGPLRNDITYARNDIVEAGRTLRRPPVGEAAADLVEREGHAIECLTRVSAALTLEGKVPEA